MNDQAVHTEPFLTVTDLHKRLGGRMSIATLRRMEISNLIPSVRFGVKGGGVFFLESDVRSALAKVAE